MYNMRFIHSKMHIFEDLILKNTQIQSRKTRMKSGNFDNFQKKMNKYSRKGLIFPENGV